MNDINIKGKKKILLIIICVLLIATIGVTFAYFAGFVSVNGVSGKAECLNINYTKGQNISGELTPGSDYLSGYNTSVVMSLNNSSCNINSAAGTIYLTTSGDNTMDLSDGALKYVVKVGSNIVSQGVVDGTGNQVIYTNFNVTTTAVTYQVYIWLDEDEESISSVFDEVYAGYIHASANVKSTIKSS